MIYKLQPNSVYDSQPKSVYDSQPQLYANTKPIELCSTCSFLGNNHTLQHQDVQIGMHLSHSDKPIFDYYYNIWTRIYMTDYTLRLMHFQMEDLQLKMQQLLVIMNMQLEDFNKKVHQTQQELPGYPGSALHDIQSKDVDL